MRHLAYFCLLLSLNLFIAACSSNSEQDKPGKTPTMSATEKKHLAAWEDLSANAKKILGSYKGIVRERNWGDAISTLKEPFDKSENQPSDGISFTQYLDDTDLNFVDISYLGQADKLQQIKLDIFLEDAKDVRDLKTELTQFFETKHGNKSGTGKKLAWEQNKTRIILEDVSTSKDPGLQITFTQLP